MFERASDVGRDSAGEVLDGLLGVVVAMSRVTKNSIPVFGCIYTSAACEMVLPGSDTIAAEARAGQPRGERKDCG